MFSTIAWICAEGSMRGVVVVIAALMTLGLAAFGIVAAQKAAGPSSLVAVAAHIIAPAQNSGAAATPGAITNAAPTRAVGTPVIEVSDVTTRTLPVAPSKAPMQVAQNTTASPLPNPAP